MKRFLLIFGAVFFTLQSWAQDVPLIKVGETELGVAKLYIDVDVVGNRMTTTYDMYFYNPTDEILEGELSFPLGEKQAVSRFALEVNGKLREAVAVEKEQGRVAFEAVVRRKIDPALLEKGTGNNYKARIYPIPAKGYKRVLLAYEEEMSVSKNKHKVQVPLSFKRKLENFALDITMTGLATKPKVVSNAKIKSKFEQQGQKYVLNFTAEKFRPSQKFVAEIPLKETLTVSSFEDYTYGYRPISVTKIERQKPKRIKLFWDVSYSMQERDLEKEYAFLERYFEEIPNVEVQLVSFSDAIVDMQVVNVSNGNWTGIKKFLQASIYDGATSYTGLFENTAAYDELLVFTDGMNTLSDFPELKTQPLFVVNSVVKANHNANRSFGETNAGGYINLVNQTAHDALEKLRSLPLRFLGVNGPARISEFYPKVGSTVFNDFSFAAKGLKKGQEVELLFGYGDVVTIKETFEVPEASGSEQIARIWGQKKVDELQKYGDEKRSAVVDLAKEFNLITNFTSLIVLESLADYEKYAILPPADLLKDQSTVVQTQNKMKAVEDFEQNESVVRSSRMDTAGLNAGDSASVSGTVTDPNGNGLLGVSVFVEGTTNGTQTDFDGNFSITAPVGENLVFSYVGYDTLETTVVGNGRINVGMSEGGNQLDEVFIVGYGGNARSRIASGIAVSTLEAEEKIQSEADVVRGIAGKVAGVQITGTTGASGSGTNFFIRSKSSINGVNTPLFVVDGVPYDSGTNGQGGLAGGSAVTSSRFLDLDPSLIEKVQVLKGLSASVLYGEQGRNGVVLITTKNSASSDLLSSNYYVRTAAEREEMAEKRRQLMREKTIKELGFSTVYLEELQNAIGEEDVYALYLEQREKYGSHPSYYVDVYDFFKNTNARYAGRILSNIIEMDNDNYELLRVYGYKLEEKGDFETAVFIYRQVLKLRSEDAQSYRDLALALAEIGQYDEALSLLTKIISKEFGEGNHRRNFKELQPIVENEIMNILRMSGKTREGLGLKQKLDLIAIQMDVRVVIDWNHNDTDIDLHIVDPNLEKCFYGNSVTKMGGMLSDDMTEGFGPEEFSLKDAVPGSYYVKVDYFGDNYQKVENPTFMKVSIYENYGTKEQQRRIKVIRLSEKSEEKLVERIALL